MSLPFLLEIGTEEIPDWMIPGALENLRLLFEKLESAAPGLSKRVIFVTGDVAGTDAEQFLKESGCRWLAKPFRLGDLVQAVKDVLS